MAHRSYPPQTINWKNLLQGITPTYAFWAVNPATEAEMVSEDIADNNLTTAGVASPAGGTLTYHLGAIKRVMISVMQQGGGAAGIELWASDDGVNFHFKGSTPLPGSRLIIVERVSHIMVAAKSSATLIQIRLKAYQL